MRGLLRTDETVFLEPSGGANLSTIVTNIRSICALGSAVFGGVASANIQLPVRHQSPSPVPVRRSEVPSTSLACMVPGGPLE